ncbi:MAG: hypothetical protein RLZZ621_2709 [Gemmatimonadota bacterium]
MSFVHLRSLQPLAWLQVVWALAIGIGSALGAVDTITRDQIVAYSFFWMGAPTLLVLWRASRDAGVDIESRLVWRDLLLATAAWYVGDVMSTYFDLTSPRYILSTADVAYLAALPLSMRALARFPGLGASPATRMRVQFDVVVACLTVATVFYLFYPLELNVVGAVSWFRDLLNLTFPVGDGMLLVSALLVLRRHTERRSRVVIGLLAGAIATRTLAGLLFARAIIPNPMTSAYVTEAAMLGWYGVLSLAAVRADRLKPAVTDAPRVRYSVEWLPWLCVSLLTAALMWLIQTDQMVPARGVSIGLFALLATVLVRQVFVNRERSTLDRLEIGRDAERRLAALVRHAAELILVVDVDSTIRFVSPSVERVLGRKVDALFGARAFLLAHPDDADAVELLLHRVAKQPDGEESLLCRMNHGAGGWRWVEIVCSNRLEAESIHGIIMNIRDVTERRELEGKLEWQAFHDPMTGLANRVLFADRVAHALSRRERAESNIGVLFIDLDHFKAVNDTFGHQAGDAVLREAARRIQHEVRSSDTVARLGGDEFAVLLEDVDDQECGETAERLLRQLNLPYRINGRDAFAGASIGVAVAEPDTTFEELVGDADVAMYVAKGEGRKRVVRFASSMRERTTERAHLEADLRTALDNGDLQVHYQPQVDLNTGEVLGAEALLRWTHPTRGVIPPSKFVPIAENAGLVVELSQFVLRTACRDAASWKLPGQTPAALHVAVNLSGRHLQDPRVVDDVHSAIQDAGLDPGLLTVEITESVMMNDTQSAIAVLRQLKALNITVAIDDFGTGYSSLSYLQQFPIDVLKIDKSFIDNLGSGDGQDALARAILSLGDALGLATVAEGIETSRQLEELQRLGCLLGQGFLLCRPMPARKFADALESGDLLRLRSEVPRRGTSMHFV